MKEVTGRARYDLNDRIKEGEVGGACNTHGREMI
jgi:hypothetical protein